MMSRRRTILLIVVSVLMLAVGINTAIKTINRNGGEFFWASILMPDKLDNVDRDALTGTCDGPNGWEVLDQYKGTRTVCTQVGNDWVVKKYTQQGDAWVLDP